MGGGGDKLDWDGFTIYLLLYLVVEHVLCLLLLFFFFSFSSSFIGELLKVVLRRVIYQPLSRDEEKITQAPC